MAYPETAHETDVEPLEPAERRTAAAYATLHATTGADGLLGGWLRQAVGPDGLLRKVFTWDGARTPGGEVTIRMPLPVALASLGALIVLLRRRRPRK